MTEAQWQDAATLRLRALDREIAFYSTRTAESIDRVMLGMAKSERAGLSASLRQSLAA